MDDRSIDVHTPHREHHATLCLVDEFELVVRVDHAILVPDPEYLPDRTVDGEELEPAWGIDCSGDERRLQL